MVSFVSFAVLLRGSEIDHGIDLILMRALI